MKKHMDQHLKVDVNSASGSNGRTPSTSDAREPPSQQAMPPPSSDWNNQFNSPEADEGPFIEQLLPFVRASAYNWFHLQAAKRRYFKEFDKRMTAAEENRKLAELQMMDLQNDRDDLKVKWATRLLGKLKKDIHNDHKDTFISAISGADPDKCVSSVADQKGKMRRIDCLRQADKVWRLDLVTIILFKGIPLESTDGERLERCDSCVDPLCINPFHMSISVRGLDIFMANYLKDVDTNITVHYADDDKPQDIHRFVKEEPGEQSIAAPHAVLGTSSSHTPVWESPPEQDIVLSYDPMKACHTYFGGRNTLGQQSSSNSYPYLVNKTAIDNNYYDQSRSVLCLPPPPAQNFFSYAVGSASDSQQLAPDTQQLDMSEDSNEEPSEKRSRDLSSHTSPNSSFCSTNDEVRRIVENGSGTKLVLGQSSSIWVPPGQFGRQQHQQHGGPGPSRQIRQIVDFRNQDPMRNTAFRSTKPIRRMTVNAGDHGDVGVVVVDERNIQDPTVHEFSGIAQTLVNALNSLSTTPTAEIQSGRKRVHQSIGSPFDFMGNSQDSLKGAGTSGSDVSPPHAAVSNLISRESSSFIASPTKFTTASGDTTSFSKILQKVERKHNLQENQPSTSDFYNQPQPPVLSSKPVDSSVKLIAPVAIKPPMMPMSGNSSIASSPMVTPRVTPFQGADDSFLKVLGFSNSNDGLLMAEFVKFMDSNSRSPMLGASAVNAPTTFPNFPMGGVGLHQPGTSGPDPSAINGTNQLGGMGLMIPPNISLAVSQPPATLSLLHQMPLGIGDHAPASPGSSNEGAANQAPVSNAPKDPNAPKLPTDFSQALLEEKK